ncbi:MAG: amidohydrolase family protein [Cyclobacteriaceae bacterium]|jgi:imidazolonepropionase-like amidohydrolase
MQHLLSKIGLIGICLILSVYNTSYSQHQTTLAITNVTIIDGNGGDPVSDQTVLVRNGRIEEIGKASAIKIPKNAKVIEGRGKFLTPGFVDSNVHASIYGGMNRPETIIKYEAQSEALVTEFVQIQLKYGVTTIRDSFGTLLPLMAVRDRINRGEVVGPRMLVAGNIVGWGGPFSVSWALAKPSDINVFQEHWNDFITQGSGEELMDMLPDELNVAINNYLDKGPDFIKYGGTSHFDNPVMIGFSPRAQKVIVDEAHKRGKVAETHSTNLEGLRMSVEAGIDLIQHPEHSTRVLPDELIQMIKDRRIICAMLSNTITGDVWQQHVQTRKAVLESIKKRDEAFGQGHIKSSTQKSREAQEAGEYMEIARTNAKKLIEAGCLVTIGTDNYQGSAPEFLKAPKPPNQEPGSGSIMAIEGLVELGMTPAQAIVSVTKTGAMAAKGLDDFGTIEKGKLADMVLLDADPLKDIANIRKVNTVFKDGKVIDIASLPEKPVFRK